MIDFLIIGQGLAGTLLANNLLQQNKSFKIVDAIQYNHPIKKTNNFTIINEPEHPFNAATFSSTGIINPITGRRFVKSWLIEKLLPTAINTYQSFEKQLKQSFLKEVKIFRTIPDQRAANDLALRLNDPDYKPYFEIRNKVIPDKNNFNITKQGLTTKKAFIVKLFSLVRCFRETFIKSNLFVNDNIQINDIQLNANHTFTVNSQNYKHIIFCEGYRVDQNPYFNTIPYTITNGQIVIIKSEQIEIDYLLKSGLFVIPIGNHLFKVGTTWDWDLKQPQTTEAALVFFKKHLDNLLKVPYEIVAHQAAVRPTVKDRRPTLGQHPKHKNMYLFNGLGAKGASLGPYFAQHLTKHILNGEALMKEVDINRF